MVMFVFIPDLLLKYEKSAIAVLPQVGQCLEIVQDPMGLAAIIWIIGEHGQVRDMYRLNQTLLIWMLKRTTNKETCFIIHCRTLCVAYRQELY